MKQQAQTSIRKALTYLASQQLHDGGFESFSSSKLTSFRAEHVYRTSFVPALMLASLSSCRHKQALSIRSSMADFLLRQRSEHWSFNYWARDSREAQTLPYPDDLDDTFCALSALWLHDPKTLNGAALASMTKLLVATESSPGGPYRTWLVPASAARAWRDIDIAVNANVAHFLSLAAQPLPSLTDLMGLAIQNDAITSPYYPNEYPILYFLARAYQGPEEAQLKTLLRRKLKTSNTSLHTALATTALLRMGWRDVDEAISSLLGAQNPDGSWNEQAFCIDPKQHGRPHYHGAAALTTAFVIETLQLYLDALSEHDAARGDYAAAAERIILLATSDLKTLDKDVRVAAQAHVARLAQSKNGYEVSNFAQHFYDSLTRAKPLPAALFSDLSLANVYGWTAYTIYDDILDGDSNATSLPVANILMRRSLDIFRGAAPGAFGQKVATIFDTIDAANAWEVTQCRFVVQEDGRIRLGRLPTYNNRLHRLAERSLGHSLPPLLLLASLGLSHDHPAHEAVQKAIHHYLIARQLNDDAHDWRTDLAAGRATYVVTQLLKESSIQAGVYPLGELQPILERQFWYHTLPALCRTITRHTAQSRAALSGSRLFKQTTFLDKALDSIDASVARTQTTINQATEFLHTYTQKQKSSPESE